QRLATQHDRALMLACWYSMQRVAREGRVRVHGALDHQVGQPPALEFGMKLSLALALVRDQHEVQEDARAAAEAGELAAVAQETALPPRVDLSAAQAYAAPALHRGLQSRHGILQRRRHIAAEQWITGLHLWEAVFGHTWQRIGWTVGLACDGDGGAQAGRKPLAVGDIARQEAQGGGARGQSQPLAVVRLMMVVAHPSRQLSCHRAARLITLADAVGLPLVCDERLHLPLIRARGRRQA